MKVKELKEMLNHVPDDFDIGKSETYTTNENWFGEQTHTQTRKIDINLFVDLKNKMLIIRNY